MKSVLFKVFFSHFSFFVKKRRFFLNKEVFPLLGGFLTKKGFFKKESFLQKGVSFKMGGFLSKSFFFKSYDLFFPNKGFFLRVSVFFFFQIFSDRFFFGFFVQSSFFASRVFFEFFVKSFFLNKNFFFLQRFSFSSEFFFLQNVFFFHYRFCSSSDFFICPIFQGFFFKGFCFVLQWVLFFFFARGFVFCLRIFLKKKKVLCFFRRFFVVFFCNWVLFCFKRSMSIFSSKGFFFSKGI